MVEMLDLSQAVASSRKMFSTSYIHIDHPAWLSTYEDATPQSGRAFKIIAGGTVTILI